ncbi:MAG: class I SAM-dependent methyltransferase [Burkholderiales bacterium]
MDIGQIPLASMGEPSTARRLHIGGKYNVPGWEVLNANPAPYVDHVCDATDLSRFPDNTFAEIYSSHVVEHFDYAGQLRVMRPGGALRVSVPDMNVLAGLFLNNRDFSIDERFFVMRMIFGGHVDQYDYHLVGLNEEFLASFLGSAGFTQISRVIDFGLFNDTSRMLFRGVPISLNMIAYKPQGNF